MVRRFEGAGLDGVIAKPDTRIYTPGKRVDDQVKHAAHGRLRRRRVPLAQGRQRRAVGSLLLGLYDDDGRLQHVGVTSAFTKATRATLATVLAPLREQRPRRPPLARLGRAAAARDDRRMPGATSRWNARQGSVVGAAALRAGGRSELSRSDQRPLPSQRAFQALARRPRETRRPAATTSSKPSHPPN